MLAIWEAAARASIVQYHRCVTALRTQPAITSQSDAAPPPGLLAARARSRARSLSLSLSCLAADRGLLPRGGRYDISAAVMHDRSSRYGSTEENATVSQLSTAMLRRQVRRRPALAEGSWHGSRQLACSRSSTPSCLRRQPFWGGGAGARRGPCLCVGRGVRQQSAVAGASCCAAPAAAGGPGGGAGQVHRDGRHAAGAHPPWCRIDSLQNWLSPELTVSPACNQPRVRPRSRRHAGWLAD
jgi:hypothetical protein